MRDRGEREETEEGGGDLLNSIKDWSEEVCVIV